MPVRILLGDYPAVAALKAGRVATPGMDLQFAPEKVPHAAFKRFIRQGDFDIGELAIVSFLQAKAMGLPLALLPAVVLARPNHSFIGYNSAFGALTPDRLAGKRVGIRSHSVTTAVWVRGILADDYGVDLDAIDFVAFEDAHVPDYTPPANVRMAPAGKTVVQMLLDGELDAAIVGAELYQHPTIKPVIANPKAAEEAWHSRHGVVPINHMIVVQQAFSQRHPELVRGLFTGLRESRSQAEGVPGELLPMGSEVNGEALEMVIRYAFEQKLIPRRFAVEELYDPIARELM